ncbi:MAG: sigma-70 family RNA polymerase sigma factor [Streptosporangiaceae bacterium]
MVAQLHRTHYRSLVKLAAVLVTDVATAEEIVQDSFVAMHAACSRPAGNADALAYLHHAVVRRCDAAARHGDAAESLSPPIAADARGVISVLRALPPRQREVLLLRFHAELSEAQVASAMGTSKSAVRSHTARAISALHAGLCVAGN